MEKLKWDLLRKEDRMVIKFSFKQMDSSDALKVYTEEKCEKLKKYFNGKITVNWNFSVDSLNKVAHCHLVGNHMDYFGEAMTEDFHASVDTAVTKIERQLRKHKEIVKDHLHKAPVQE